LIDLLAIAKSAGSAFHFRTVGPVAEAAATALSESQGVLEVCPKQPQDRLKESYAWADLYLFPTIQDGFPVVLAQAQASALPILTTPNCSGPEVVDESRTGWILPIRSPGAFLDRLSWCNANRGRLVKMIQDLYQNHKVRDWTAVADDFLVIAESAKR
jgi:glycosyltransferase involved in cell wall biosynthesis